ncbi:uncharacterized protein LOC107368251 [Tetranychus urticae]|uniref:SAYSvFN domain-containing protein n=1 Tax=Tetranychus urticae TaxID=32264 RepID=T1KXW5_TETUR|nr:uncharacterized protein LOC107368251 [Tetranychus urticae]
MTKLEEQLLLYRAAQRERKEKAEQEAKAIEDARRSEEIKKQKEKEKEEGEKSNQQRSLFNFLLPTPPPSVAPQPRPQVLRPEPRIAYFRDGDEDEDGMYVDYLEDELDFDYGYLDGYEEETGWTKKDIILALIKFSVYAFLQYMAFKAEWGAVFFTVSLLYFIYYNTRTRQRMIGEPSAYSVFNDGCEPIDGAMDADRMVNQLTLGQMVL